MSFNRTQSWLTRRLYQRLERRAARVTTAFISVADAMTDQAVAAGIADRDRFTTIRSGMDVNAFAPSEQTRAERRQSWGVSENDVVIGTIARLFENKGYEQIIAAMPSAVGRAPNLRFVWIGDGAHRGDYEERLVEIGLRDRVHFVGLIRPDEVASHLCGFDAILHASRWEGLPRAIVQGLLTGIPAVSFDNDGAPEVVLHDQTGILVPYGDVAGLTDAIVTLASDAELRQRLGARGRTTCARMFDWRKMVDEIEQLYARLLQERP